MVHPVIVSGLVPVHGHEALGGTVAHVLEAGPGPPTGKVVARPHTGEGLAPHHVAGLAAHHASGLAAHHTNGQGHRATAVVGALLHGVLEE